MKIGFIGCGNMGGALARAICRVSEALVYISDHNSQKAEAFAKETGATVSNNEAIAEGCDFVFLAVKPSQISTVLPPLRPFLSKNPHSVIVTMAAGVTLERVGGYVGKSHKIIRIMPNTPVAVGSGMITWCKNSLVSDADAENFEKIMSYAGRLDAIDEPLIDAASALSGCGPAFVYMFAEALADGAVQCGLPREKANLYAAETLKGAAEMLLKSGKHPGLLKDEVCSPGGSTIEGVHALEEVAFRADTANAIIKSYEKTKRLGKE